MDYFGIWIDHDNSAKRLHLFQEFGHHFTLKVIQLCQNVPELHRLAKSTTVKPEFLDHIVSEELSDVFQVRLLPKRLGEESDHLV